VLEAHVFVMCRWNAAVHLTGHTTAEISSNPMRLLGILLVTCNVMRSKPGL
jgi:hypothetical protein